MAKVLTPLPAAVINTASPGRTLARFITICQAVRPATGSVAPSSNVHRAGNG
jgi:hypothetical protein